MEAVVGCRRQIGEEAAAMCAPDTGERREESLEQVGNAGEGPLRQARLDGLRGVVVKLRHDRIDRRIARLHASDGSFQYLRRADLPRSHQFRETQRIVRLVFCEAAHRRSPWCFVTSRRNHSV